MAVMVSQRRHDNLHLFEQLI